jgi:phosphotransferase system enzyme I (PtsI)
VSIACTGIGVGVSRKIAVGEAHLLLRGQVEIIPLEIAPEQIEQEAARFRQAVHLAAQHLRQVRDQIPSDTPSEIAAFIDTHLLMLEDSTIAEGPIDLIRELHCCAEWALQVRRDELVRVFEEMEDPYLRTRKDDVDHVVHQIQKILMSGHEDTSAEPAALQGKVILAQDLTPADTILMRHQGIAGFVTEFGSPMSHTAILARSLGIPAVVGVRQATHCLRHGEPVVVDGEAGVVLADVDPARLDEFRRRIAAQELQMRALEGLADQPAISRDGAEIVLMANIELLEDIAETRGAGAQGVGLYRTEFLYMNRDSAPDEEEHLRCYLEVIRGLEGIPITIRTLDLGADKPVSGPCALNTASACNPALGLRAIRLCLKEPRLFRTQLRAILRASAHGPVRLMLPMLSNLSELREALALIEATKQELRSDGIDFNPALPVGGMIEVPAAALCAEAFARRLDFLSIGTNDLIQYTLAIDRMDDTVNYLYEPLHPAVLRLIKQTIDAAGRAGTPISMCGEMAGDPRYTRLLLGLGLSEFSMQPGSLPEIKQVVRNSDREALQHRVTELMGQLDELDAEQLLAEVNRD